MEGGHREGGPTKALLTNKLIQATFVTFVTFFVTCHRLHHSHWHTAVVLQAMGEVDTRTRTPEVAGFGSTEFTPGERAAPCSSPAAGGDARQVKLTMRLALQGRGRRVQKAKKRSGVMERRVVNQPTGDGQRGRRRPDPQATRCRKTLSWGAAWEGRG
jgi:hypothetical protein